MSATRPNEHRLFDGTSVKMPVAPDASGSTVRKEFGERAPADFADRFLDDLTDAEWAELKRGVTSG